MSYDVDGLDWQDPNPATVQSAVLDNVRPGSIVSLHLGHQVTVDALPKILAGLSARAVSALLFGVTVTDPAAMVAVAAFPLVALGVSLHPAWRATRVDPAEVLRAG